VERLGGLRQFQDQPDAGVEFRFDLEPVAVASRILGQLKVYGYAAVHIGESAWYRIELRTMPLLVPEELQCQAGWEAFEYKRICAHYWDFLKTRRD